MIINLDPHSGIPVYRQLIDQIRFQVASGLLPPGEEIPSTRSLSARLGVNPMTISKAFQHLEQEGVLERRPGRPLVVRARADESTGIEKLEQLRDALRPAAGKARRLGVEPREALQVFRQLLEEHEEEM
jgi:GntR family transcriptional regulator